jgi:hypothetical protein
MRYEETVNVIPHHSSSTFIKTIKSGLKISLHRHFKLFGTPDILEQCTGGNLAITSNYALIVLALGR